MTVNETVRQRVRERANGLCEYCHSPERICTTRFTIDHILPRSLNGDDRLDNLAFACRRSEVRENYGEELVYILLSTILVNPLKNLNPFNNPFCLVDDRPQPIQPFRFNIFPQPSLMRF